MHSPKSDGSGGEGPGCNGVSSLAGGRLLRMEAGCTGCGIKVGIGDGTLNGMEEGVKFLMVVLLVFKVGYSNSALLLPASHSEG